MPHDFDHCRTLFIVLIFIQSEKRGTVRAIAEIRELKGSECKHCIVRNLSKILDIRIVDINLESKTLSFLYETPTVFAKVKSELKRIGYPMQKCIHQKTTDIRLCDGVSQEPKTENHYPTQARPFF